MFYREDIRGLLKRAVGKNNEQAYLLKLGKLQEKVKPNGTETQYIKEWENMLSLDDGISDTLLRPEEQRFMTKTILEKMKELTKTDQERTNVSNVICFLDERLQVR